MKNLSQKLLLTSLVLASLFTVNTGQVRDTKLKPKSIVLTMQNSSSDLRVKALERVFAKHNSPLLPYARAYVETSDKYNVDWKLLPAIAGLESSYGKHQMPGSHNSYGWG
ncbi:MAG: hypothetical protein ABIW34_03185, partial [Ginsengibacter sp.]